MVLIAATGVYLFTEIMKGFLDEKLSRKPVSGLLNCKKQDDLNAMAIKTSQ